MSNFPYLLSLLLAIATPAYSAVINRRASPVVSNCKHDFAMTFDNGPFQWQDEIVDQFDCANAKTTFFVNGNHESCIYSEENVQRLRYAHEAGHVIASHTWSNADLSNLSEAQIDVEIQRLDEALVKILGVKPKLFRAPNNYLPDSAANYITTKYGKTVVSSDVDSGDTNPGATTQSIHQFYQGLASQGPGHPHLARSDETQSITLDALDATDTLIAAGIRLVSVAECLDMAPYEIVGNYGVRDSSWTCDGSWSPPAAATCTQTYTASATDKTCAIIATKFGLTGQAIAFANPTLNCGDVWQWTQVCIPSAPATLPVACAQKYTTSASETCQTIAAKFGVSAESFFNANTFVTCSNIWAGTGVCIPYAPPSSTTSAAPSTGTCVSTYSSKSGDNCQSIEAKFSLPSGSILQYNSFVNCADIWAGTPLCIGPSGSTSTTSTTAPTGTCVSTYNSKAGDNCQTIEAKFNLASGSILKYNTYVNCADIWAGTPLCIGPSGSTSSSTTTTTSSSISAPTCVSRYTSVSGDNCDKIGAKYGLTGAQISAANTFVSCNDIWVNTNLCIPSGGSGPTSTTSSTPPAPTCASTYTSVSGDNCTSIGTKYGLTANQILAANTFLSCSDIWANTPICIPSGGSSTTCTLTISSPAGANCDTIGAQYGVSGAQIKTWNDFLTCTDIWANTPVCVRH